MPKNPAVLLSPPLSSPLLLSPPLSSCGPWPGPGVVLGPNPCLFRGESLLFGVWCNTRPPTPPDCLGIGGVQGPTAERRLVILQFDPPFWGPPRPRPRPGLAGPGPGPGRSYLTLEYQPGAPKWHQNTHIPPKQQSEGGVLGPPEHLNGASGAPKLRQNTHIPVKWDQSTHIPPKQQLGGGVLRHPKHLAA